MRDRLLLIALLLASAGCVQAQLPDAPIPRMLPKPPVSLHPAQDHDDFRDITICVVSNERLRDFLEAGSAIIADLDEARQQIRFDRMLNRQATLRSMKAGVCDPPAKTKFSKARQLDLALEPTFRTGAYAASMATSLARFFDLYASQKGKKK